MYVKFRNAKHTKSQTFNGKPDPNLIKTIQPANFGSYSSLTRFKGSRTNWYIGTRRTYVKTNFPMTLRNSFLYLVSNVDIKTLPFSS